MKKFFSILLIFAAILVTTGCGNEENNVVNPTEPTTMDIVHTSWQGIYQGTVQHPQAGSLACVLTWTIDFVDESNVSIMLEMSIGGQAQEPKDMSSTYTFDGRRGEIINEEGGEVQRDSFEVDPVNRTFSIDFRITTGFSQEEPQVVGGLTTFHQIH